MPPGKLSTVPNYAYKLKRMHVCHTVLAKHIEQNIHFDQQIYNGTVSVYMFMNTLVYFVVKLREKLSNLDIQTK